MYDHGMRMEIGTQDDKNSLQPPLVVVMIPQQLGLVEMKLLHFFAVSSRWQGDEARLHPWLPTHLGPENVSQS